MVKLSISCLFLVATAVWAQHDHGDCDYRVPQLNTQQAFGVQEPPDRFLPSPDRPRADYVYQAQQRPVQQHSQSQAYNYHTAPSDYQNVNSNEYDQDYAENLLGVQNTQQPAPTDFASSPNFVNTQAQQPVITKHIYFHLPPPDNYASAAPIPASPPKKIYNIIFIKLPPQKSLNAARLHHLINRPAALDKTLIYVLVKKPEAQPVQPVTSKPEVFFVKYKEPRSVELQAGDGAAGAPSLLPGLINGHL